MNKHLAAAILLVLPATSAVASDTGFYLGAGFGQSDFAGDIPAQIQRAYQNDDIFSFSGGSLREDGDDAQRLFAGYRFRPWFGLELGWVDMGRAESRYTLVEFNAPQRPPLVIDGSYELDGISLAAFGEYAFNERFSAMVRAGVMNTRLDYAETGVSESYDFQAPGDSDTTLLFGLGLNWRMTPRWDLRLDYDRISDIGERFEFQDSTNGRFDDVDLVALNLAYRFGR